MRRLLMLMSLMILFLGGIYAQDKTISGTVIGDDGLPIPGASVMVKGTTRGTVTDMDGKYLLSGVEENQVLVFKFIGLTDKEITVGAQSVVDVTLESDSKLVDEVVVTAMGMKRSEKALGYSATSVKGDEIAMKRSSDMMSGLAGKVAGVQISMTSSDPGASNSVVIRGVSSLTGSNQPLYVIDGVPLNNSTTYSNDGLNNGYDFGNGANAVNPDDIENMTILKGAAATALYGSRAAGGVVMITTKSGKKGKGIGIEYNGGLQWSGILRLPQMQNDFGMGWDGDKTDNENGSWGPRFDGTWQVYGTIYNNSQKYKPFVAMENNIKDFFDTGFRYSNSLSFNGATDNSDFFVSFSQISDDGIVPTDADTYDKYTFSMRGSHKTGSLTFSASANYAYQQNSFATTGQGLSMYNCILQSPRDISFLGLKDLSDPFNTPGYYYTPYGVTNPYYILENYKSEYRSERFYGKFQFDYDITKFLKFSYRFGLDQTTASEFSGEPNLYKLFYSGTPNGDAAGNSSPFIGKTGSVSESTTRRREMNHDVTLMLDLPIGDKVNINALVGFNGNERWSRELRSSISDLTIPMWYNLSNTTSIPQTETTEWKRRLMGLYGQLEASWNNMFYATFSARNDFSSTLPEENRSFFYPGVTGSFIFSELLPDDMRNIFTFGKVRVAWGKTGNDADVYKTKSVYEQGYYNGYWSVRDGVFRFPFQNAGYNAFTVGNKLGSNTLSPEMTTETEFGLNMAFLNNRLSFDVAYYSRSTDKQVYSLDMDPATGYNYQNTNLGEVENKGVELLVSLTPIRVGGFEWTVDWNMSKNKSKVISLPESLGGETVINGLTGDVSMYAIVGMPVGVFKAEVPMMTEDGKIVCGENGLPKPDSEMAIVGDMNSKYQMGFSTALSWKGLSLSADLDIRKGGVMYSHTKSLVYFTGNAMQTAYNDRNPFIIPNSVVMKGDEYVENTHILSGSDIWTYWDNGGSQLGSSNVIDKSYVKLRSVILSWDVPSSWTANTKFLQGARISAYGNNLWLWTPKSNTFIDPESTSFGNDLEGSFGEFCSNPSSRHFGMNLMLKF